MQLLETGVVDFWVGLVVVGRDVVGVALAVVGRCVVAVRLGVLCRDVLGSLDGPEESCVAAAVLSDAGSNRYPAANDAAASDATSPVTNSSRCVPNLLSQAFTRFRHSSLHLQHPCFIYSTLVAPAAHRKLAIFLTRIADRRASRARKIPGHPTRAVGSPSANTSPDAFRSIVLLLLGCTNPTVRNHSVTVSTARDVVIRR